MNGIKKSKICFIVGFFFSVVAELQGAVLFKGNQDAFKLLMNVMENYPKEDINYQALCTIIPASKLLKGVTGGYGQYLSKEKDFQSKTNIDITKVTDVNGFLNQIHQLTIDWAPKKVDVKTPENIMTYLNRDNMEHAIDLVSNDAFKNYFPTESFLPNWMAMHYNIALGKLQKEAFLQVIVDMHDFVQQYLAPDFSIEHEAVTNDMLALQAGLFTSFTKIGGIVLDKLADINTAVVDEMQNRNIRRGGDLAVLRARIAQQNVTIKEFKKRVKKKSQKIAEYKKLSKEQLDAFTLERVQTENRINVLMVGNNLLTRQLKAQKEDIDRINNEKSELQQSLKLQESQFEQLDAIMRQDRQEYEKNLKSMKQMDTIKTINIAFQQKEIQLFKDRLEEQDTAISKLNQTIIELSKLNRELVSKNEALNKELLKSKKNLEDQKRISTDFELSLTEQQESNDELNAQIEFLQNNVAVMQIIIDVKLEDIEGLRENLLNVQESLRFVEVEKDQLKQDLKTACQKEEVFVKQIATMRDIEISLRKQTGSQDARIKSLGISIASLEDSNKALAEKLKEMKAKLELQQRDEQQSLKNLKDAMQKTIGELEANLKIVGQEKGKDKSIIEQLNELLAKNKNISSEESVSFGVQMAKLQEQLESERKSNDALLKNNQALSKDYTDVRAQMDIVKSSKDADKKNAIVDLENKINNLVVQLQSSGIEKETLDKQVKTLNILVIELKSDKANYQKIESDLKTELKELADEISDLDTQLVDAIAGHRLAEERILSLNANIHNLKGSVALTEQQNNELRDIILKSIQQCTGSQDANKDLIARLKSAQKDNETLQLQIAELQKSNKALDDLATKKAEDIGKEKNAVIASLQGQLDNLQKSFQANVQENKKKVDTALAGKNAENENLKKELTQVNDQLKQSKNDLEEAKKTLEALKVQLENVEQDRKQQLEGNMFLLNSEKDEQLRRLLELSKELQAEKAGKQITEVEMDSLQQQMKQVAIALKLVQAEKELKQKEHDVKMEELMQEKAAIQLQLTDLSNNVLVKLKKDADASLQSKNDAEGDSTRLNVQVLKLQNQLVALKKDLANAQKSAVNDADQKTLADRLTSDNAALAKQLKETQGKVQEKAKEIEELNSAVDNNQKAFEEELKRNKDDLVKQQVISAQLKTDFDAAQAKLIEANNAFEKQKQKFDSEIDGIQEAIRNDVVGETKKKVEAFMQENITKLGAATFNLEKAEAELQSAKEETDSLMNKITELTAFSQAKEKAYSELFDITKIAQKTLEDKLEDVQVKLEKQKDDKTLKAQETVLETELNQLKKDMQFLMSQKKVVNALLDIGWNPSSNVSGANSTVFEEAGAIFKRYRQLPLIPVKSLTADPKKIKKQSAASSILVKKEGVIFAKKSESSDKKRWFAAKKSIVVSEKTQRSWGKSKWKSA